MIRRAICLFFVLSILFQTVFAQAAKDELSGYNDPPSRLRGVIDKYDEDVSFLNRFYSAQTSPKRAARFKQIYNDELALLGGLNFDALNHDEQVDYILFKNYLDHELREQERAAAQLAEMAPIPFGMTINDPSTGGRSRTSIRPWRRPRCMAKQIAATKASPPNAAKPKPTANRAVRTVDGLRTPKRHTFTTIRSGLYVVVLVTVRG